MATLRLSWHLNAAVAVCCHAAGVKLATMAQPIEFIDAKTRQAGENRSKLLCPTSPLFQFIDRARATLLAMPHIPPLDVRPPHIEVLRDREVGDRDAARAMRALELAGRAIDVTAAASFGRLGKALVMHTGPVSGYGATHSTIAFFPSGLTDADAAKYIAAIGAL